MAGAKILIVEDERLVADQVRRLLLDHGYAIVGIEDSGTGAVASVQATPPDLVVMDIRLSGDMDGIEAAQKIRQLGDIPIIFLTAYGDDQTLRRAEVAQPFGYILKPFRERELIIAIDMALYKHGAESKLRHMEQLLDAEKALRQSEERTRMISELTSDYAYTGPVDADGTIRVEEATEGFTRVTGYSLEEMIQGGGWSILIHPDDLPSMASSQIDILAGRRVEREIRIRTKQGATRWIRYLCQPRWDQDLGRVTRILGAVQDITERKLVEGELQAYTARLEILSRRLIEVQEIERRHLARELHDEVGQVLTAINIILEGLKSSCPPAALPRLEEGINIVQQTVQQVRNMSLDLRPSILDDFGLASAVRWFADRQARLAGFALHLDIGAMSGRLPTELETACFRLVQEALTNVVRHAKAKNVWVKIVPDPDNINLHIRDDGVGFDFRAAGMRSESFGLFSMQERVQLLNGQFSLHSSPNQGTAIDVQLPRQVRKTVSN